MKHYFLLLLLIACCFREMAQTQRTVSLTDMISMAQSKSPLYQLASTKIQVDNYAFLSFRSELKPQVLLYGNAPVYNKSYDAVTQPDGTIRFVPVKQNYSNAGLSLTQQIGLTGGAFSISTDLSRFDEFRTRYRQYNATPLYMRIVQPLFTANDTKWAKKIEPLKLEESRRAFVQEMEDIAGQIAKLYFDVLDAQTDMAIAGSNLNNTKINYDIESRRVFLGTTTEDRLLQLELQNLRSRQDLAKAGYDYQMALLALRATLGASDSLDVSLEVPDKIPHLQINLDEAKNYAKKYRPEFIAFERKRLEAKRDLEKAKSTQQVTLTASYGLNRAADQLKTVYSEANDQQRFAIGFNVPIIDWGRHKARYNSAKALESLANLNNQLDENNFLQEITVLIRNFPILESNIELAKQTDSVANRRYTISNSLYQAGKLSITDLNIAQNEKDNARRFYLRTLREFWNAYYRLRKLTMYDFNTHQSLYPGK